MRINGYTVVKTCDACPEQYEVFDGDKQVGYLRLRHGEFRVHYPDHNGRTIFCASPAGDGMFEDWERRTHLNAAIDIIEAWMEYNE